MKRLTQTLSLLVAAFAVLVGVTANAADVSNTLTAGTWSETRKLVGDVYQVTKMTRLTNAVSTTARLDIPANALQDAKVTLAGSSLNANGVSNTLYLYPTPADFKLTGGTTSYTDLVSVTTTLADTTSAAPVTSGTVPGVYAGLVLTGGATISTSEVLDVRVNYTVPKACRWPKC